MLRYCFLFALVFGVPASALAQSMDANVVGLRSAVQADTGTWFEGERAGRLAAAHTPVGATAALGFLGGLSLGFSGLIASTGNSAAILASAGGITAIGLAARGHVMPSDDAVIRAGSRGSAYARGFSDGYTSRATGRRKAAAIGAGVGGTVAGVGCLFLFLSMLPYT